MSRCDHIAWLELYNQGRPWPELVSGSRLGRLSQELPRPSEQVPQITFFMGRRRKDEALRQFCKSNYRNSQRHQRSINLRSDNRSLQAAQPRFFADCDPTSRSMPSSFVTPRICHPDNRIPVDWPATDFSPHDLVLSRVLFAFVDLICIFADDIGGLTAVQSLLRLWDRIGLGSNSPRAVSPRVLIVLEGDASSITHTLLDESDFFLDLGDLPAFSDIQISRLSSEELSSDARHIPLARDVSRCLRDARQAREHHCMNFSAYHLSALFDSKLRQTTSILVRPYNYLTAAREQNPLDGAFTAHLTAFLTVGGKSRIPYDGLASYIASAILMDAYPPGMHHFCPKTVFRGLYRDACYTALRHVYSTDDLAQLQCSRIEYHLQAFFNVMKYEDRTSSQIHRQHLQSLEGYWLSIMSNETCLLCIRRSPEHVMSCGHSICDTCTEIYGEKVPHIDHAFTIQNCLYCRKARSLMIKLKPPTAAARVLSIDGGGPRGIIPLECLQMFQDALGEDLVLQDMIDFATGTSSGGLIVLSAFMLKLDIASCKIAFKTMLKRFFQSRRKRLLNFFMSDATYSTDLLDDLFREHFGSGKMFDSPKSTISATKVAITACSIDDASPFIFTNYNGMVSHKMQSAYSRLRPSVRDEPFLWQVARATAAAPPYMSTIDIPGVGTFQDGGMRRHNNPTQLAFAESKRIWPTFSQPDIVISLGTGSETLHSSSAASHFRNIFADGWMPRIYRSFISSFDGKHASRELLALGQEHFRFDTTFPGSAPSMTDTKSMAELESWARIQPTFSYDTEAATLVLLATSFYFTLKAAPEFRTGLYYCTGYIRCRAPAQALISRIYSKDTTESIFYKDDINLGLGLSPRDICLVCQCYSCPVYFYARNLDEVFTISLRQGKKKHRISAFPKSIQWFVDQQGLDNHFGATNHDIPSGIHCDGCEAGKQKGGKKRKYMDIQEDP
ncbi:FabD/lysophospholipase-like protein [Aspergillus japonicus CBS 114.51]|uniref:FabD/lysophospholipase-like protein n=1 Tax=Aspergillus japonicus CBS 114.51 TaxID=1448312 RepID=A0A8T8XJ32_ASPJA|nr:FabD/lysophospholipase-like protein [Aspergillus japonicus CBS 114.51]RAH87599.1 FabD/lysophospholipase-like protein [Aspergillus japonicus CBS 114.51]